MGLDLPHPVFEGIEGCPVVDGVHHNNTHCTFVVGLSDGFESLLPCCVPDLQPDFLTINFNSLDFEINANGGQMRGHEIVLAEAQQDIGLAHSTVPYNEQLGKIIIILVPSHQWLNYPYMYVCIIMAFLILYGNCQCNVQKKRFFYLIQFYGPLSGCVPQNGDKAPEYESCSRRFFQITRCIKVKNLVYISLIFHHFLNKKTAVLMPPWKLSSGIKMVLSEGAEEQFYIIYLSFKLCSTPQQSKVKENTAI